MIIKVYKKEIKSHFLNPNSLHDATHINAVANSLLYRALRIPSNIEGIKEEIDNVFCVLDNNGYMRLLHKVLEKITIKLIEIRLVVTLV